MKRHLAALLLALAASWSVYAAEPLRLDASTDETTVASWNAMVGAASPTQRQQLLEAMLKINLAGINSANEMLSTPDTDSLGIVRIKEKVSGLTAEQIIDLSNKVSTVRVEHRSH
jgi:hypothetical protein